MTSVTHGGSRRIGLLGGTFDPPHIGHLSVAVDVRFRLGLDFVALVPNGDPWQKRGTRAISAAALRLAMAEAAVTGLAGVDASDVEVRRPGASYTIDTVEAMLSQDPHLEVTVVVGSDAARGLPTWERYRDLLDLVTLAVVARAGDVPEPLHLEGARIEHVATPGLDVSSTEIRRRVAAGEPIDVLAPAAVIDVIEAEGLYRGT